mgnify:CR=1 FL=1
MTKKISQLTALSTPADDDVIVINDTSTGVTKKMTRSDFFGGLVPPGIISAYISNTAPTGYLLCDGTAVSRSTYATLFAIIGTTYGAGDGSTTFNVPNLKGKVAVGKNSSDTEFDTLAETGGAKTHTLTTAEMPTHNHTVSDPSHAHGVYDPGHSHRVSYVGTSGSYGWLDSAHASSSGNAYTSGSGTGIGIYGATTGITLANAGSGSAHNNIQPYLVVNYIIKT